jgi:DNA-directed RNA polymerase subunit RPC12/RpoP
MLGNLLMGGRIRCPLCMVPPLQSRGCARHRTAEKTLGSYRLRVAKSILLAGSFRCPYCGEPTAMQVRQRVRR